MKAPQCIFILLSLSLLPARSFRSVPLPPRIGAPSLRTALLKSVRRDSNDVPNNDNEPILLPPADYSKPGHVVNLSDDSGSEVGHVMLNRKLTISFTCNVCDGHSSYQINRVSFMQGIVVLWCKHCNQKHLIADNLGKLDFPEFGRNLEEFMAKKGTPVKRVVMSKKGLSHVVSEVPGPDYPAVNPYLVSNEGDDDGLLPEGFDCTSLLPGAHVGAASLLPGELPPTVGGVGAGGGETVVDAVEEGGDAAAGDD